MLKGMGSKVLSCFGRLLPFPEAGELLEVVGHFAKRYMPLRFFIRLFNSMGCGICILKVWITTNYNAVLEISFTTHQSIGLLLAHYFSSWFTELSLGACSRDGRGMVGIRSLHLVQTVPCSAEFEYFC